MNLTNALLQDLMTSQLCNRMNTRLFFRCRPAMITVMSLVALLRVPAHSADPDGNALLGRWYTKNNEAIFEFYTNNETYSGRLTPLKKPHLTDRHNPVDSLKSRKLAGATTIWGLRFNPEKKRWEGGSVYNPEDGKTYHCTCRLAEDEKHLKFRGYLGVSALGQTQVWTRVDGK